MTLLVILSVLHLGRLEQIEDDGEINLLYMCVCVRVNTTLLINPRRTSARVMVVAVSVCLSITTLAVAWQNSTLKLRYD